MCTWGRPRMEPASRKPAWLRSFLAPAQSHKRSGYRVHQLVVLSSHRPTLLESRDQGLGTALQAELGHSPASYGVLDRRSSVHTHMHGQAFCPAYSFTLL